MKGEIIKDLGNIWRIDIIDGIIYGGFVLAVILLSFLVGYFYGRYKEQDKTFSSEDTSIKENMLERYRE